MDSRRPAITRIVLYAAAVGVGLRHRVATGSIPSSDEARDFGDSLGPAAPFLFVPLFVLANFLIAWAILAGAVGLLFGTAAGTPLALAGVTLAALAQMAVSRGSPASTAADCSRSAPSGSRTSSPRTARSR